MSPARTRTRTPKPKVPRQADSQVDGPFVEQCLEAVTLLDRLLEISPYPRFQELDVAERAIVRLRDGLIERLRQEDVSAEAPRLRGLLERANIAISMIVGLEYPASGMRRQLLETARDALQSGLAEG